MQTEVNESAGSLVTADRLAKAIKADAGAAGGSLTCPRAFVLARQLGVSPADVGGAADRIGIPVSRCQLGLFGYGSKAEGKNKAVPVVTNIGPGLALDLKQAAGEPGGLTCEAVWHAARRGRVSRLQAAGAAEALGLRIRQCQLGCFKPRPAADSAGAKA